MVSTRGRQLRTLALIFLAVFGFTSSASAQVSSTSKLDRVLSARARQLTGRSRVIVEFHGAPDVRAITAVRGVVIKSGAYPTRAEVEAALEGGAL